MQKKKKKKKKKHITVAAGVVGLILNQSNNAVNAG